MLNILAFDRKYISFTIDLRRYILPFLLSLHPFPVDVGGEQILVKPRSSDLFTIYEIYRDGGYSPKLQYTPNNVKTIVDLGANIGVFSLWASRFFPAQKIYAVEMEHDNFAQLTQNIAINDLQEVIIPVQAAIFNQTGSVGIRRMGGIGFHMVNVNEKGHTVKAISLADFLDAYHIETIDLLKVDIEGGEKYLMTPENEEIFRTRVGYVFLESHDVNDFRTEHGVAYLQKLGFETTLTSTPYVIDHNFIIDARNPALSGSEQRPEETLSQLEAMYGEMTQNAKGQTLAGSPAD